MARLDLSRTDPLSKCAHILCIDADRLCMANKEYSDLSAKYEVALVTIDRLEADISGIAGRVETIEGWRDSLSAVFQKYRQLIRDRLHEDYFEQQSNN